MASIKEEKTFENVIEKTSTSAVEEASLLPSSGVIEPTGECSLPPVESSSDLITLQPYKIEQPEVYQYQQIVDSDVLNGADEEFRFFFPNYGGNGDGSSQPSDTPTTISTPSTISDNSVDVSGGFSYVDPNGNTNNHSQYWQHVVPYSGGWQSYPAPPPPYYPPPPHHQYGGQPNNVGYYPYDNPMVVQNDGQSYQYYPYPPPPHPYRYTDNPNSPSQDSEQKLEIENFSDTEEEFSSERNIRENSRIVLNNNHHQNTDNPAVPVKEIERLKVQYGHQRFPIKLWNLATDEHFQPIQWSESGQSLVIDELMLEPNLEYLFRSKKFTSFLRQLHLYGFRKVTRARYSRPGNPENQNEQPTISEYCSTYFSKGDFELVKKVRRYYPNSAKNRSNKKKKNSDHNDVMEPATVCDSNIDSGGHQPPIYHHQQPYGSMKIIIGPPPPPAPPLDHPVNGGGSSSHFSIYQYENNSGGPVQ